MARLNNKPTADSLSLEEMIQKIVATCLRCDPIPACDREDNQLEPPWEVIDRILRERNEAREQRDNLAAEYGRSLTEIMDERDEARELYQQAVRDRNEILSECARLKNALENIAGTPACLKDEIDWYMLREIAETALDYKEL